MAEKLLTLSLRKYLVDVPRTKRRRKTPKYIRERVAHYMKLDIENVKLSQALNSEIVKYYSKTMLPIKLSINIDNNVATVNKFSEKAAPVAKDQGKKGKDEKKQDPKKQVKQ